MGNRKEGALNSVVWGHIRIGFSEAVLFELRFEMNGRSWGNGEDGRIFYAYAKVP